MFREAITRREITYIFVARGKRLDGWANLALLSGCARLVYDGPVYAGEAGRAYRIVPHCEWPQAADAEQ
jgi:hypothetical protein